MPNNQQLATSHHSPPTSGRFVRGLLANLRYWQVQTAVINDDVIRGLNPDFPNVVQAVEMGLVLAETWRETAVLIRQCFFWVEGSGRVTQWQPLLEKCLAVMPAPDDWLEFRLLKQLGQLQRIQWELDTAVTTFKQAGAVAQALQNDQAIAEIHMNLCQTFHRQHRYDNAQAEGVKALALFTESQCRLKATTLQSLGHLAQEQGQYDLAETHFREALNLMHRCEITSITDVTRTMDALAETHRAKKQYAPAIQLYQEIADLLAATTKDEDKIRVNLNKGSLFYDLDNLEEAEAAFWQAELMLRQQKGLLSLKALVANNLGCVLRKRQEWSAAGRYHRQSINLYRQIGNKLMLANAIGNFAKLYKLQGRYPEALRYFDEAMALTAQFPDNVWAKERLADFAKNKTELIREMDGIGMTSS